MEFQYQEYKLGFEKMFNPDFQGDTDFQKKFGDDSKRNTSIADYVWLPFRFDGDMAVLDWKDEWRIEDYE